MDLTISIVNLNTKYLLEQCLNSIYDNVSEIGFEVFIVDNGSNDGSVQMVKEKFPWVKLIENISNVGFARANNQVINKSKSRYILLINSDTILLPGTLATMVGFMDSHPAAGIVGCKLVYGDGTLQRSARRFPTIFDDISESFYLDRFFPRSRIFSRHNLGFWEYDEIREVDWVSGACLMVRKEAIQDIGLLDERFFMYSEEMDWCFRMRKCGWKVYYKPNAQVVHFEGVSSLHKPEWMYIMLHRSQYLFRRKHYGRLSGVLFLIIALLGNVFKLCLWWLAYIMKIKKQEIAIEKMHIYWQVLIWYLKGCKFQDLNDELLLSRQTLNFQGDNTN